MFKKHVLAEAGSPSSKAAALLARGACFQYVSTAKGRERRWRLFSTFPIWFLRILWIPGTFFPLRKACIHTTEEVVSRIETRARSK
jgi:hypothetical protein